jgi:hypothetical protein
MDNLPAHKNASVRVAIEAVGAVLLFRSPYSPDFNPIQVVAGDGASGGHGSSSVRFPREG